MPQFILTQYVVLKLWSDFIFLLSQAWMFLTSPSSLTILLRKTLSHPPFNPPHSILNCKLKLFSSDHTEELQRHD